MKVIVLQHISAAEFSHQFIYGTGNAYSDAVGSIVRDDAHRERLSTGQHRMVLPRKLSTYRVFRAVFLSEGHDNKTASCPYCLVVFHAVEADDLGLLNITACCRPTYRRHSAAESCAASRRGQHKNSTSCLTWRIYCYPRGKSSKHDAVDQGRNSSCGDSTKQQFLPEKPKGLIKW